MGGDKGDKFQIIQGLLLWAIFSVLVVDLAFPLLERDSFQI